MENLPARLIAFDSSNFNPVDRKTFKVTNAGALDIDVACLVGIKASQAGSNEIMVQIDADPKDPAKIQVSQNGNTVIIHQDKSEGVTNFSMSGNGINIRAGNISDISMRGGTIRINGKIINGADAFKPTTRMARILIAAPEGSELLANLSQTAELVSLIGHSTAELSLSGQSKAALTANSVEADISGQSAVQAIIRNGELKADISGQSRMHAMGVFAKVKAEASGQSTIETEGQVNGNYKADASGQSNIIHRGQVFGSVKRETSGMSQISVR